MNCPRQIPHSLQSSPPKKQPRDVALHSSSSTYIQYLQYLKPICFIIYPQMSSHPHILSLIPSLPNPNHPKSPPANVVQSRRTAAYSSARFPYHITPGRQAGRQASHKTSISIFSNISNITNIPPRVTLPPDQLHLNDNLRKETCFDLLYFKLLNPPSSYMNHMVDR